MWTCASGSSGSRSRASWANACSARLRAPCSHQTSRAGALAARAWSMASTGVTPMPAETSTTGVVTVGEGEHARGGGHLDGVADAEVVVQVGAGGAAGSRFTLIRYSEAPGAAGQRVAADQRRRSRRRAAAARRRTGPVAAAGSGAPSSVGEPQRRHRRRSRPPRRRRGAPGTRSTPAGGSRRPGSARRCRRRRRRRPRSSIARSDACHPGLKGRDPQGARRAGAPVAGQVEQGVDLGDGHAPPDPTRP